MVALPQINATSPHPDVAVPFDYKALLEELEHERREKLYWQEVAEQVKHLADDLEAKLTAMRQREERHLTLIEELDTTAQRRKNLERLSSSVLSAGQKDTVSILYDYFTGNNAGEPNADGFYPIESKKLALRGGMASGTMNHHINYMATVYEDDKLPIPAKLPLFEKRLVHIHRTKKLGDFYEETWLKPTPLFWDNPLSWQNAVVAPRQQGGADRGQGRRKKCACGGDIVEKHITISMQKIETCLRCKTEVAYPVQIVGIASPVTIVQPDDDPDGGGENSPDDSYQLDLDRQEENSSNFNQVAAVRLQESLQQLDLDVPLDVDTLVSDCNGIPDELKTIPHWVLWRSEAKKDEQGNLLPDAKPDKVPYQAKRARSTQKAKVNDPETWGPHEQTQSRYEEAITWNLRVRFDGIGFMFNHDYTGVDFDHCVEDGTINEQVLARIQALGSYAEISPSGTGVHVIVRGTIPRNVKLPTIEMYDHGRFFTFTGNHIAGTPTTIEPRQDALDVLFAEVAPPERKIPEEIRPPTVFTASSQRSDERVPEQARTARNGEKFRLLYDEGKWWELKNERGEQYYPSQSEADEGLCGMLAYWNNGNPDYWERFHQIDRLFRQSKLYRSEKWDEPARAGETYGEGTIKRALGEQWEAVA